MWGFDTFHVHMPRMQDLPGVAKNRGAGRKAGLGCSTSQQPGSPWEIHASIPTKR